MLSLLMLNLDRFQFLVTMLVAQLLGQKPVRLMLLFTGKDPLHLSVGLLTSPRGWPHSSAFFHRQPTISRSSPPCIVLPSLEMRNLTPSEPATLFVKLNPGLEPNLDQPSLSIT